MRGWLFEPVQPGPPSAGIVMIHGFSATSTGMVADRYAEGFAESGAVALLFDPRGFGRSDGEPQLIDPWRQARDYLAGIDFLQSSRCPSPDHRIGVWGDSMSGEVALVVASVDPRISAVIVQVPALGDEIIRNGAGAFESIRDVFLDDDLDMFEQTLEGPLPVVSADQSGTPSMLRPLTAFHWFISYGARFGTGWQNQATVATLNTPVPFSAQSCIAHVEASLLMIVAEEDEMPGANADVARHCFKLAPHRKELVQVGGGHFGLLYHDSQEFRISVDAQCDFVGRHLAGSTSVSTGATVL